jgi:MFS family permease
VLQAIYLLGKGYTAIELGLFASTIALSTTLMEIPTGFVADKFSRKLSVSLGFLVSGLSYLGILLAKSLPSLLIVGFFLD